MQLSELCRAAAIYCPEPFRNKDICGVTCNLERVKKDTIFVCVKGERADGESFAKEAVKKGAVVLHRIPVEGELYSDDTRMALARLCRAFYGEGIDRLRLIAVTGTNGKTTVTELLHSIFTRAGHKCGKIGTLGIYSDGKRLNFDPSFPEAHMTTPDPEELYPALAEMSKDGCEYVFMEVSSHALALKKIDALMFELGIFTNLTRDHLDFHYTFENYLKAKARLSGFCKKFIVNADDPFWGEISAKAITCSEKTFADFMANSVMLYGGDGCEYVLSSNRGSFSVRSHIAGRFTVMNTMQAAACALTLGISDEHISDGIADLMAVPGRMERIILPDGADLSVFVDYAHTPDALENILKSARRFSKGSKVLLVFGCGGDRDRGKRKLMGAVATKYADLTIITSDNPRTEDPSDIINDILKGIDKEKRYAVIENRADAIRYAVNEARSGNIILLAGKGHEKYEIDKEGTHPFDESFIVRKAWKEK